MNLLLKSVQVFQKSSSYHKKIVDIAILNGIINQIEEAGLIDESSHDWEVVDGTGYKVSPGWFDLKANFEDPGMEHKEDLMSGSITAAAGGFTEVVLLPNTHPVIQTKNDIRYIRSFTETPVTLHPIAAVTKDAKGDELTEMIDLNHAGAIAFSDGDKPLWNTQVMLKALQYMRKFDGLLINKPEDKFLNALGSMHEGLQSTLLGLSGMPALAEAITIERDLKLLAYLAELSTGYSPRLHFSSISTKEAVILIREAKTMGLQVSCDVAAHQLFFTDDALADFDTNFKVNPPLRDKSHQEALLEGLADGTIDVIVSGHSPQDEESKKCEFDLAEFGILGLQTVFPIINSLSSSSLSLELLIEKISSSPRKLLKLPDVAIEVNATANLTIFSDDEEWLYNSATNYSRSVNSPFFGKTLKGKVLGIVNNNQFWLQQEHLLGKAI